MEPRNESQREWRQSHMPWPLCSLWWPHPPHSPGYWGQWHASCHPGKLAMVVAALFTSFLSQEALRGKPPYLFIQRVFVYCKSEEGWTWWKVRLKVLNPITMKTLQDGNARCQGPSFYMKLNKLCSPLSWRSLNTTLTSHEAPIQRAMCSLPYTCSAGNHGSWPLQGH